MLSIVKNDLFDYKNRYIYQSKDGFRFSLDSILLGEFATLKTSDKTILDMCTGNGVVPLIISLKTNSHIVGFEIQKDIALLAQKSVELNDLQEQISIINDDVNLINNYFSREYFDVITCNPPYFKYTETNYVNHNDYLLLARHEIAINLEQVMNIASQYLKNKGIFYLVQRASRLDEIIVLADKYNMHVKEVQLISTKVGSKPQIVLIKCVKNSKMGLIINKEICVENLTSYQHIFDRS